VSPSSQRPVVTGDISRWLNAYTPRKVDAHAWAEARRFVIDTVTMTKPTSIEAAARATRVLTKIAVWAPMAGLPLDREQLLDPATIEHFIAVSEAGSPSRATDRWQLRKIGPLVTRDAPWEPRPASVARRNVAVPYTPSEMTQLRGDADRQPTRLSRQAARTMLVLGAGAGLDGRWVARVTPHDISSTDGTVLVRVGHPQARVIPVLAAYEDEVLELAASCNTSALIGIPSTSPSRVAVITQRLQVPPRHPRFSAARFRSTWLAAHLDLGTRLPELMAAAGLQGFTHLSDLVAHLVPLEEADARRHVRGAR